MAFSSNDQCIHCDVESCKHWEHSGMCKLDSIQVGPRQGCHSGECDESQCSSYKSR